MPKAYRTLNLLYNQKPQALNIIWKYYLDSTIYNLMLSAFIALFAGIIWGSIIFGTIGTAIGFMMYAYFKKNEYYFYFNYGYSKKMLMRRVWGINTILMLLIIGMYAVVANLF